MQHLQPLHETESRKAWAHFLARFQGEWFATIRFPVSLTNQEIRRRTAAYLKLIENKLVTGALHVVAEGLIIRGHAITHVHLQLAAYHEEKTLPASKVTLAEDLFAHTPGRTVKEYMGWSPALTVPCKIIPIENREALCGYLAQHWNLDLESKYSEHATFGGERHRRFCQRHAKRAKCVP